MKKILINNEIAVAVILIGFLLLLSISAGCTQSATNPQISSPATGTVPVTVPTTPAAQTTTAAPTAIATTPRPVYTPSSGNVIAFTAASLSGASNSIASAFTNASPGHTVTFNLDGTQALKTQVESGAYADDFISASNSYTTALKNEGYFVNDSVKTLTTNYVVVILPASNPGKITSLADLSKPGIKIAMAANAVPVGTATTAVLNNLANSTYNQSWENATIGNVVTYETSEPAVATKVQLGAVDAGFVYQSTATAAPNGTYLVLTIPKKDNYLQTYTIGVLNESTNKDVAMQFEQFMLSQAGQNILQKYGFLPP